MVFSPVLIGLLLLLLLGLKPLQPGGWFVAGCLITGSLAVTLVTTVGHGHFFTIDKSNSHTGLDLVAGGVLLGLGLKELLNRGSGNSRASRLDSVAGRFLRHATASALTRHGCVQSCECQLASDPAARPCVGEPERVLTVLDRG